MPNRFKSVLYSSVLVFVVIAGCTYDSDDKSKATTRTSDRALRDPYGKWSNVDSDVSGGNVNNLDRNALKRDVDNFLLK